MSMLIGANTVSRLRTVTSARGAQAVNAWTRIVAPWWRFVGRERQLDRHSPDNASSPGVPRAGLSGFWQDPPRVGRGSYRDPHGQPGGGARVPRVAPRQNQP